MTDNPSRKEFWDAVSNFRVCHFASLDDGQIRARPLAVYSEPEAHEFRFLTSRSSHKMKEVGERSEVNLTFMDEGRNAYVSVSGRARVSTDRNLIRSMWTPAAEAWFEDGPDNPDIAVLIVEPTRAEYWEGPASLVEKAWEFASAATGKRPDMGENAKLSFGS